MKEEIVNTDSSEVTARIFGAFDAHAREIEKAFGVDINNRAQGAGDSIVVTGEEASGVRMAASVLTRMRDGAGDSEEITDQQGAYLIGMVRDGQEEELSELSESTVCITGRGKPVRAKTVGQKKSVRMHTAKTHPIQ